MRSSDLRRITDGKRGFEPLVLLRIGKTTRRTILGDRSSTSRFCSGLRKTLAERLCLPEMKVHHISHNQEINEHRPRFHSALFKKAKLEEYSQVRPQHTQQHQRNVPQIPLRRTRARKHKQTRHPERLVQRKIRGRGEERCTACIEDKKSRRGSVPALPW